MSLTYAEVAKRLVHFTDKQLTTCHKAGKRAREQALAYFKAHGFPIPATIILQGRGRVARRIMPADVFWQFMAVHQYLKAIKTEGSHRMYYFPANAGITSAQELESVALLEMAVYDKIKLPGVYYTNMEEF